MFKRVNKRKAVLDEHVHPILKLEISLSKEFFYIFFQPCLAACEDQVHKFLVTHASYPNEDSFVGTVAFCNLLQKLVITWNSF